MKAPDMRHLTITLVLTGAFAVSLGAPASAESRGYGVFCANGRIEIDSRTEEEMRRQRGACQFARFPFRADAEGFARRNFNGVGASCSCR
jgi:hypothetical protein